MTYHLKTNSSSTSTTWTPQVDRMPSGPRREANTSRKRPSRFGGLSGRNPKSKLDIKISYRGGAEAWWLVETRGRSAVFPGHMCIHDVMCEINQTWELKR